MRNHDPQRLASRSTCSAPFTVLFGLFLGLAGPLTAGETCGWRGDSTGRYPDATPVLEWGPDTNVVWKTAMSTWGNATPVLTSGKIIVTAEPTTIVCADQQTGAILWQTPTAYADVLTDPAELAKLQEIEAQAKAVEAEMAPLNKTYGEIRQKLRKAPKDEALKAEAAATKKELDAVRAKLTPLESLRQPKTHGSNGYASATPVTDGTHIWAVFGTGVVVCLDLEGKRIWGRRLENPPHREWGFSMSPQLVGDLLLVHIDNLHALDRATGETRWTIKSPWGWGTAVHGQIGGQDALFTSQGEVVRIADGKVVAKGLARLEFGGPILGEQTIFYIQGDAKAYTLPAAMADSVTFTPLWKATIKKDRYYGSPLLHDGLIYAITRASILTVLDAKTGDRIYEQAEDLGKGDVFPSITLGGKHIFVSHEKGTTLVLEPGREHKIVARNTLEPFRATPVFQADRMYIRGLKILYCIGK